MGNTLVLATLARDLAIPSGQISKPEMVERHPVSMTAPCFAKQPPGPTRTRLQESSHLDSDSKIESQGSTMDDTPVGL
jgi:hypothetical protein